MTAYFSEHRTAHTACLMRIHYVKLIFIDEVLIAFSVHKSPKLLYRFT